MRFLIENLQKYPEIAIYLALAVGFLIGPMKIGSFGLGTVTSVLLTGVLIGWIASSFGLPITISSNVKAVFFLMFLFAVGYGVGPQFFRGLRGDGIPQVLFAILVCVAVLLSTYVAALIAGYDMGQAAGLLSGAATISAVLGVATDTINQLGLPADQSKKMLDFMPIAYAVTYLYGTAGSAWFLATIGPKLLRVDIAKACKEYEEKLGGVKGEQGGFQSYTRISLRAFQVSDKSRFVGRSVADFEGTIGPERAFVQGIRQGGTIVKPEAATAIRVGDVLAVSASRESLLRSEGDLGTEIDDRELLNFTVDFVDLVVTKKELDGKTIQQIVDTLGDECRGVYLRKLIRAGQELPFTPGTIVNRGDVLHIFGSRSDTDRVIKIIGYADRPTDQTNVVFMGFGIVVGALIGALSVKIAGIPLSLSTSGGALIAGLVCGYLRAVNPTFGRIPEPALWAFNNMGLNIFIAVVGISTGPGFVKGLKEAGLSLFLWGIFVTTVPFIIAIFAGKWFFKMHPGVLLGACAGARTTTAALGAVQDVAHSNVPALGYTITYAIGNTLLIIWGVVIVLMLH